MSDYYCIIPMMNNYSWIIYLLGYVANLEKDLNFIIKMPIKPKLGIWMCLLSAFRSHNNVGKEELMVKKKIIGA